MTFDKYYENLFEGKKLNKEYITYLTSKHIVNLLSKKDIVTNKTLLDIVSNYSKKYRDKLENFNTPLCFLYDDIYDLYSYTEPHIQNILNNAKSSIIKETKLVSTQKIKFIEPKTMVWLASKPGATFREKLAQTSKVSTNVKKYSYNIKANQLVYAYYKKLYKLLMSKLKFMKNNSNLFGSFEENREVNKLKLDLNKLDHKFKDVFEEVIPKDISKANNILLGNVDYRSIWSSYVNLKREKIKLDNVFDNYRKLLFNAVILKITCLYNFIENPLKLEDLSKIVCYSIDSNDLETITFDTSISFEIKTEKRTIVNGKYEQFNLRKDYIVIKQIEKDSLIRGLAYELYVNDINLGIFYADLLGFKNTIDKIIETLNLSNVKLDKKEKLNVGIEFISINSFDNSIYGSNNIVPKIISSTVDYTPNNLYYAEDNLIYLNDKNNEEYSTLLKYTSSHNSNNKYSNVIYDIQDTFDEFSSIELRRTFNQSFAKSYPVWRSILAGESIKNKDDAKFIIDLCGNEFSISKLGRKQGKFIHYGPIDISLHSQKHNEYDFLFSYLKKYQDNYNIIFPEEVQNDIIYSGKLTKMFYDKETIISFTRNNEAYCLEYDKNIFDDINSKFEKCMNELLDKYKGQAYCIVPNFVSIDSKNVIFNYELINGVRIISERVNKKEATWYEVLPNLSLEIIKDGMYDELTLVKDLEYENIIGKKLCINSNERFTLTKGEKNYILPLNKSFIGEQNKSFVAKVEDKSFPLSDDIDVKLRIEYSFGSENSYQLFFEPIDKKSAPFSKIKVLWEKEGFNEKPIPLKIVDVIYTQDNLTDELSSKIPKSLSFFDERINKIRNNKCFENKKGEKIDCMKEIMKDISNIINKEQRISRYSESAKEQIRKMIKKHSFVEKIQFLIEKTKKDISNSSNNEKRIHILKWRLSELEEALVAISLDRNLFIKNKLTYPDACYGRYLAEYQDDEDIISLAYNNLIIASSKEDFLNNAEIRRYLNKITGATAVNHLAFSKIQKHNSSYCLYLLKVCTQILKQMSAYDWDMSKATYINSPKENGFLIRHCVEIIISLLFCRNSISFNELMPGGKYAKELIHYLKVINRKYNKAIISWPKNKKKPNMISKYHLHIDKPQNLKNVWTEAYCLILGLSGDERCNYISMDGKEND